MKKPRAKKLATRAKPKRLEPADVLQLRMEYYMELFENERKLGEAGSRVKMDEYLRQTQDAAKELGPYRHGRASAGDTGDGEKKTYIVRMNSSEQFKDADEWLLWSKAVMEKEADEKQRMGFESANERIIARWFADKKKPAGAVIN